MLTFFSLQSTNRMLFFAFADSFLIRTCLGILFASLLMLLSYTNTSPSLCNVLYTLSFPLSLQWFCYPLLSYSAITVSNSSVPLCFSPSHEKWWGVVLHVPGSLLRWVCVCSVIRLRFMMDWVCMARFASRRLSYDCVSAGGVVGPVSNSLCPLQQLLI